MMRIVALVALLLLVLGPALSAGADEGDTVPVPVPVPPAWSPPSGVPAGAPLPTPRVVGPSGQPVAGPAPAAGDERYDEVPSGAPYAGEFNLGPDEYRPGGEAPSLPPAGIEALLARAQTENAVLLVRKNHNQQWRGAWQALELDMLFHVYDQVGMDVGVSVTFYEMGNGRPLRARMEPYVDADGNVSVYTKLIRIQERSKFLRTKLMVPYRAFPWPTSNRQYEVQARVRLLRRAPDGSVSALARGATSFTIQVDRDCKECRPARLVDCPPPTETRRRLRHDVEGMFGEGMTWQDEGVNSPNRAATDPPAEKQWFEAKWRSRIRKQTDECLEAYDKQNQVCRAVPCPGGGTAPPPRGATRQSWYRPPVPAPRPSQQGVIPAPPSAPAPGSTR